MDLIPAADPKAAYLAHREEIDEAVRAVLESGWYILGKEVSAFEKEFAAYLGADHGIGVGSGTDAIQLALRACGIGPGDGVVTVSHTAVATVAAIDLTGAEPVLVDIDPATFTMDPNRLEETLKARGDKRIRAVVPVHLYGHPANMDAILDLARRFGLYVIEDCAQSHGALYQGKKTGSMGHFGAFSFYPTKNLGALGDGGACVCGDAELAEKARLLRQYGWRKRYTSEFRGTNTRLDEIQAAILRIKLRYLDSDNERRRRIAATYRAGLAGTDWILPCEGIGIRHVYHQYTVRTPRRDEVHKTFQDREVGTAILYPSPVHRQPGYAGTIRIGAGGLTQSEIVCRDLLCLPVYPQLTDQRVSAVIDAALLLQERLTSR
jgi:dTDP-4-amino-4,6-dideoxygalactose transaminase